jgi:KipI family sensor histidine kinase inhibitor
VSLDRPVRAFGDGAVVVDVGSVAEAHALAAALRHHVQGPEPADIVVGYRSVTVIADPERVHLGTWANRLSNIEAAPDSVGTGRRVRIPVCFDGPDLHDVAGTARTSPEGVVEQLTAATLSVAFIGFLPGFAYLDDLPPALARIGRRAAPRSAVPAGSVALAGGFAGVYPRASPGGWQLVGRTRFALFDPEDAPFSTLVPGDEVQFVASDYSDASPVDTVRAPLRASGERRVRVHSPGMLSMVQDLGREGVAHLGVPSAGAADADALRAINRLVGNADGAAGIEVTATGPRLSFDCDAHLAVSGDAVVVVDDRALEPKTVVPVTAGQIVTVGSTGADLRCYLAIDGGIVTTPVLGSRSSDVLTGLGPGPLRAGDVLDLGAPTRPHGRLLRDALHHRPALAGHDAPGSRRVVRVLAGPDLAGGKALERLARSEWEVGEASDRMGVRLQGDGVLVPVDDAAPGPGGAFVSRAMVSGAVQVPPDGRPVVLLCDHATVGGYPVVATVIRADLGVLGRCRPGDVMVFAVVDAAEAQQARAEARRALDRGVVGWFPGRVD